ncbi:(d)CMP kinase [Auritidibacter ignavus]|uniref:(d)CMP kinase n=1 Tax=Auritidibacter ignavus TaxID=678932 RepID=UPI00244C1479|nr:(d)CMP kinase [Auritidibacter ignavus]WGH84635.1 (d)CMP kinase [Auritidibacter ignavus]WGH86946.1 (d)CMP kinase [Auritidibacter ignavus]WGH89231.1 (d)CMP kinase [Auritidibacter ignavus]WHS34625.1 (d)CMP kinase [Auritidibacter ignavus]
MTSPRADHTAQAPLVIAIDGPSGSGKSTVAKALARHFQARYLDTGAMYRTAALWCHQQGVDLAAAPSPERTERIIELVQTMPVHQDLDPDAQLILLDGSDVTEAIRDPNLSSVVSAVSTIPQVREILIARQRQLIAGSPRIVAEGRDITTVVAPQADARLLLTASETSRMARRGLQQQQESTQALSAEITERDQRDLSVVDFMTPADGVALVDSTELDLDETIASALQAVQTQLAERTYRS